MACGMLVEVTESAVRLNGSYHSQAVYLRASWRGFVWDTGVRTEWDSVADVWHGGWGQSCSCHCFRTQWEGEEQGSPALLVVWLLIWQGDCCRASLQSLFPLCVPLFPSHPWPLIVYLDVWVLINAPFLHCFYTPVMSCSSVSWTS